MAQVYNKLQIDVHGAIHGLATPVQNDANSRFLDVVLLDNGTAINLTGHEVRIYCKKPESGGEVYNNGEITDAVNGRCQFPLTDQTLAKVGHVEAQISIFYENVQILQTHVFKINVVKSLMSESSIEGSNEYGALVVLFQELYEAKDLMTTMVQNIGVPGEIAEQLTIDTMWDAWEYMCDYVTRTMQLVIDASLNQGSIMEDGKLFLPKMLFEPLISITDSSSTSMTVKFVTEKKIYCSYTGSEYKIVVFDTETMKKIGETASHTTPCNDAYVYNGKIYYADNTGNKIIMYDDSTYAKLGETAAQTGVCSSLFVDNERLYCKVATNKIAVFDPNTLAAIGTISISMIGNIFVYNNVIYASTSGGIRMYNAETRASIGTIDSGTSRANIRVDNDIIFATDYSTAGKKVFLYDVTTRQKIGETAEQKEYCQFLFVENGIIYFVCDGKVLLIDVATQTNREEVFTINTGQIYVFVKNGDVYYSDMTTGAYKTVKLKHAYKISHYEMGAI